MRFLFRLFLLFVVVALFFELALEDANFPAALAIQSSSAVGSGNTTVAPRSPATWVIVCR